MTYTEALEFLSGLGRFGLQPGLDTTLSLSALAGNPERRLRFIHVAGTNGKGSTCAFVESICRRAGLRVGLYTSPHLVSFRERIQVDRVPVPEEAAARLTAEVRELAARLPTGTTPTFFEFVTVMALRWFEEQRCDLVVWETGLGGRWDATNIVQPLVSVVTNIGWDHMEWLGSTLGAIAGEKAGILKGGVPAVTAEQGAEPLAVLRSTAMERGASLRVLHPADPEFEIAASVRLALRGGHQRTNAALAIAAVGLLPNELRPQESAIREGLETTRWSGRFQVFERGGQVLVLDGAHNRPGFEALAAALREEFPRRRYGLVLGMLADKDAAAAVEHLLPGATATVVVPVQSARGGDPDALVEACRRLGAGVQVSRTRGLAEALNELRREEFVVVTGSLYLVGEALGIVAGETNSERALNDWNRRG